MGFRGNGRQLVLGYRLGYRTLVYTEDAVRWPGFVQLPYSTLLTSDVAGFFSTLSLRKAKQSEVGVFTLFVIWS